MIASLAILSVFLPFLGGIIAFATSKKLVSTHIQNLCIGIQGVTILLSVALLIFFFKNPFPLFIPLFKWVQTSFIHLEWIMRVDKLSVFSLVLLHTLSFLIYIYSISYMAHETSRSRFYIYLSLFVSAMAFFMTADSLVQLLLGGELVGVFSFLLMGFWYDHAPATQGAYKAFIINRIGDIGLIGGVIALFLGYGTFSLETIFNTLAHPILETIPLGFGTLSLFSLASVLFVVAAMAKSAQFGLHTWLPDTTEAPIPASALLHSATLGAAGVFLLIRLAPLLNHTPFIKYVIIGVGSMSALLGATCALTETNIKRILAFSTISQLGFVMIAIGLGVYWIAFFHLTTHAIFKSLLFLGSSSVIYACEGEHNIFEMPKINFALPFTYTCLWVGILSLGGMPLFTGFFSQEKILEASLHCSLITPGFMFGLLQAVSFLTVCYGARLMFALFHEKNKDKVEIPLKTFSWISSFPMVILAMAAGGAGYMLLPYFASTAGSMTLGILSLGLNIGGLTLCGLLYAKAPKLLHKMVLSVEKPYLFFKNNWYFEEAYTIIFVKPFEISARFLSEKVDYFFIDKICIEGIVQGIKKCNEGLLLLQSGNLTHYLLTLGLGMVMLIGYLFL